MNCGRTAFRLRDSPELLARPRWFKPRRALPRVGGTLSASRFRERPSSHRKLVHLALWTLWIRPSGPLWPSRGHLRGDTGRAAVSKCGLVEPMPIAYAAGVQGLRREHEWSSGEPSFPVRGAVRGQLAWLPVRRPRDQSGRITQTAAPRPSARRPPRPPLQPAD